MRIILLALVGCTPTPLDLPDDGGAMPPWVVSVSIGSEGVSPTAVVDVEFSEPLDESSVVEETVAIVEGEIDDAFRSDLDNPPLTASRSARTVPVRVEVRNDGEQLRVEPAAPMMPETGYTLAVSRAVRDRQGTEMEQAFAHRFTTAAAADGAPVLTLVAPEPGGSGVPTNLARVLVQFSEEVLGVDDATLRLAAAGEDAAVSVSPAENWCRSCYEMAPKHDLAAGVVHAVRAGTGIRDSDGNPLFQTEEPSFTTGPGPDQEAPVLWLPEARVSGGCLLARWLSDEPATSEMLGVFDGQLVEAHDLGAMLSTPGTIEFHVESADAADNRSSLGPLFATYVPGPDLVVTEVLANPFGPEPAQEWVEVANLDEVAVSLAGMQLADEGGGDELPSVILSPGGVALVVGEAYDPLEGSDPPPGPEAILVRVSGSLAHSGLRNSGERVELRDESGAVLSSYGGHLNVSSAAGQSAVRVSLGGCDVRSTWGLSEAGGSTPGRL